MLRAGPSRASNAVQYYDLGGTTLVSVGRRVQEAVDHMGKGDIALALTAACIALDVTSKRYVAAKRSSGRDFKKFVKDHLWLITFVGFPGLMASTVRVPF